MTPGRSKPAAILLVADELLVRLTAHEALEEAGYNVIEARDGQEALAILEIHPDVRLLFTDITMPNLDGVTLARLVRSRWPHIAVLVTSALPPPAGTLPEDAAFLPKPYKLGALIETVGGLLEREPPSGAPVVPVSPATERPWLPGHSGGLAQALTEPDE